MFLFYDYGKFISIIKSELDSFIIAKSSQNKIGDLFALLKDIVILVRQNYCFYK